MTKDLKFIHGRSSFLDMKNLAIGRNINFDELKKEGLKI